MKELSDREKNLTVKLVLDEEFKVLNKLGIKKKGEMTNFSILNSLSI